MTMDMKFSKKDPTPFGTKSLRARTHDLILCCSCNLSHPHLPAILAGVLYTD